MTGHGGQGGTGGEKKTGFRYLLTYKSSLSAFFGLFLCSFLWKLFFSCLRRSTDSPPLPFCFQPYTPASLPAPVTLATPPPPLYLSSPPASLPSPSSPPHTPCYLHMFSRSYTSKARRLESILSKRCQNALDLEFLLLSGTDVEDN